MTPDRLLSVPPSPAFWLAIAAYAAAASALLIALAGHARARPVDHTAPPFGGAARPARVGAIASALVVVAFAALGVDIAWRGFDHVHPAQSVREALGLLAWILTGGYLIASMRFRLTLGGVVVMPVALVLLLLARLTPVGADPALAAENLSALGRVHISLATLGVAIFALASALSAIYLFEERALKRKKFEAVAFKSRGAPLESLDRMSHRLVWIGFPIFTLALVLGAVWTTQLGESVDRVEYALSAVTWIAFASLLVMRQIYGWRGRRAAHLALAGFAAALAVLLVYLVRRSS